MKERDYQARLIKRLKADFPGCIVMKNDSSYIQGIADLTVLYKKHWAMLECKISEKASRQPNQEYYVARANEMSYAAFIFPENEELVFNELHSFFNG